MKYNDLKEGDIVVFKRYNDILEKEDYQDGNIISIDTESNKATIIFLDGYKTEYETVSYDNIIAKFDANGEIMKFGSLNGTSVLLEK